MVEIFADVPASPPERPPTKGEGILIREPGRIAAYVAIAKAFDREGQRVELEDPPIVVETATGAKVLGWVLIDD